jgi:uncharacterized C2H2 Zn-finger protein
MAEFMQDRYGNDKLNNCLLVIAALLYIINLFARSSIMIVIIILLMVLVISRALSKNINKRLYENRRFTDIFGGVGDFFKRQYMRVRDIKTHRYIRCPYCKAQLRLKKRTGVQQIHCPRCGQDFKKNILF